MTARDTERGSERQREIPRRRQRKGRERMKNTKTKRQRKRESTQPCTPSSSARFTQTLTLLGRRPAVRRKPLKSGQGPKGPRPGRVLAVGISPLRRREWSPPPAADLPPTYRSYRVLQCFWLVPFFRLCGSRWVNMAQHKPKKVPKLGQHGPKMGQHRVKMGQHSPQAGSR